MSPPAGTQNTTLRKARRYLIGLACIAVLGLLAYISATLYTHNLRPVVRNQIYRSGQMSGTDLACAIRRLGLKSIVNLRGTNSDRKWFQTEKAVACDHCLAYYTVEMSARHEASLSQMEEIVYLIREAPKPLLLHCDGGADRAGLVAALVRYRYEGKPADEAKRELSIWYGHLPWLRPGVISMDRSFAVYVSNAVANPTGYGNAGARKR